MAKLNSMFTKKTYITLSNRSQSFKEAEGTLRKKTEEPLVDSPCGKPTSFGISTSFEVLSPSEGQVAYALLTRLPLESTANTKPP